MPEMPLPISANSSIASTIEDRVNSSLSTSEPLSTRSTRFRPGSRSVALLRANFPRAAMSAGPIRQ